MKPIGQLPIYLPLVVASFIVGRGIPAFYDWTGSDQSRPSPLIPQFAIGLIGCGLAICLALPWLPLASDPTQLERGKFRFKIRTILILTTAAAVLLAVSPKLLQSMISNLPQLFLMLLGGAVLLIAFADAVRSWIVFPTSRMPMASLLACMYFPFSWIVKSGDGWIILPLASGLPAMVPTMLLSRFFQTHYEQLSWLGLILTGLELFVGVRIIRRSLRGAIAYQIVVLVCSILASFALNALVRM